MKLALRNIGVGTRSRSGGPVEKAVKYWDEDDRRARYNAVSDSLWIYQDREVEQNLRRFDWRQARRRVLAQGALSREWMNRGRGDLRLTRRGLQMRFASGVRTMGWKELKDMIGAEEIVTPRVRGPRARRRLGSAAHRVGPPYRSQPQETLRVAVGDLLQWRSKASATLFIHHR